MGGKLFNRGLVSVCLNVIWMAVMATPAVAQIRPLTPEQLLRASPAIQMASGDLGDRRCAAPKSAPVAGAFMLSSPPIVGVNTLDPERVRQAIHQYEGHGLSQGGLQAAESKVNCEYWRRGFVFARARAIRDQTGAWRIVVQEGVLGHVEVAAEDPRLAALVRRAFRGLKPGHAINARDVRRGLVVATAYGVPEIRPTVRRSRRNPELLDIILVASAPAPILSGELSNSNSQSLGRWGGLAALDVEGLTPLYEHDTLSIYQSLDRVGQTTVQLSSRALLPVVDTGIGGDFAASHASPTGELSSLKISSTSLFGRVFLERLLAVRRGLIVRGSTGLEAVNQSTDLLDTPFIRDRLRIAFLHVDMETQPPGGGVLNASIELRKGLAAFDASRPDSSLLSISGADPQALVTRAQISYGHALGAFKLSASVRGQYADRTLTSFEQMTFGSLNGGRGFDPAAVAGDRGVAASFEVEGPRKSLPFGFSIVPFAFTDGARITTVAAFTGDHRWAVSTGGGVHLTAPNKLLFDVTYAAPVNSGGVAHDLEGPRLMVNLHAAFDVPFAALTHLLPRIRGS